jgi:hypothetical protein
MPNHGYSRGQFSQPLGKEILVVSPVMLENYDANLAVTMHPAFDSVWNAVGQGESPYYDGDEWKGLRKFHPNTSLW